MRYLLAPGMTLTLALAGCIIESGLTPSQPASSGGGHATHHDDDYDQGGHDQGGHDHGGHDQGGYDQGHAGGASAGGGGNYVSYDPDCQNRRNHCLDDDVYLTGSRGFDGRRRNLHAGILQGQPDSSGEATFMLRRDGSSQITRHYWQTRPGHPDQLQVGQLIAYFRGNSENNIYEGPMTRDAAQTGHWAVSRVVSKEALQNGYVVAVGRRSGRVDRVSPSTIRFLEGDDSPSVSLQGPEDKHHLRNHYLYSSHGPRDGRRSNADVLAPIQEPSDETRGEGHFMHIRDGNIRWTSNWFRTRPATADDIRVGEYIVYFRGNSENNVYQTPASRLSALTSSWAISRVIDDSRLFRGVVQVAGRRAGRTDEVAVDAARVIVEDGLQR